VSLRTAPVNFTITQRPISYSITSTTAVYGSVAPGTVTWSNLCGGDDPGAVISVSNSGGSPVSSLATASVGTYSETVSSLSNSNYTLASTGSTPGTLTITPRPLTWSVANTAIVYGTAAVPGAASLTGIVNNDMVNAVVTVYDGANTAVSLSPATKTGTYSERVTAISNSNYTLAATGNTPGILTINTAPWQSDSYTGAVGTAEQRAIPGFINAAPLFRTAGFQLPDSLTVIPPGINLTGCLPLTDSELSRLSKPDKQ
ncbi:MAG: MBG domain-containing protein, partial [Veillonellales bacterium]